MPKRKRGARRDGRFKSKELLDSMAGMGLPTNMRLVALAIYSLGDEDPAFETLGWRTGLSTTALKTQIGKLKSYNFLKELDGNLAITLPDADHAAQVKLRRVAIKDGQTPGTQANKLIDVYKKLWVRKYRKFCSVNGTSRTKALALVNELGFEEAKQRLENYMLETDKWISERSHSFHIFTKLSNQYTRRPHARQGEARIAEHGRSFEDEVAEFEKREGQKPSE